MNVLVVGGGISGLTTAVEAAEKLANESPVKLLFPLFVFIFPAVIIVMIGPIILRAIQSL